MTGIGRRALFKAGAAAGIPGLGKPAPSSPPRPSRPESAPGDDPATKQVVRARQVIVSGPDGAEVILDNGQVLIRDNAYNQWKIRTENISGRPYMILGGVSPQSVYLDQAGSWQASVPGLGGGQPETWHPMAPDKGWAANADYLAPQYRLTSQGDIQFSGLVSRSAAFTATIALNSGAPLPDAYRPGKIKAVCQGSAIGSRARVEYHSDGILYAVGTTLFRVTTAEIEGTVSST